jgi:hypothetical protein
MAGNDIEHPKQQQTKLHHIPGLRAIVISPPRASAPRMTSSLAQARQI